MGIARKVDGVWLVRDEIDLNRYDLEGTIEEVIACLNLVKEKALSLGMTDEGRLDIEVGDGYYGGYELGIKYYFDRSENDKERASRERIEADEKARKAKERKKAAEKRKLKADAEFAEYERLKAKFESV